MMFCVLLMFGYLQNQADYVEGSSVKALDTASPSLSSVIISQTVVLN